MTDHIPAVEKMGNFPKKEADMEVEAGPSMSGSHQPIEIFCSYAHEHWRRQLDTHLSLMHRQGLISLWHDRQIIPSQDWARAIDTNPQDFYIRITGERPVVDKAYRSCIRMDHEQGSMDQNSNIARYSGHAKFKLLRLYGRISDAYLYGNAKIERATIAQTAA